MKRLLTLVMSFALLFSLAACAPKKVTVYQGFGVVNSGRKGPGVDDKGVQVWSFNEVYADALFDKDGKILSVYMDILEVATPNYDGVGMPHFSGFPGQGGYNLDANHDGVVDGKTLDTPENFTAEVNSWLTKRARGADYKMTTGTWTTQMDRYQKLFVGKTVAEVEAWAKKYTSDLNGRPLLSTMTKPEDVAKYAALTADDKTMLTDVTSSATMSLKDAHGDILGALKAAYDNRIEYVVQKAAFQGFGAVTTPRTGPGKDVTGTQVWSFNTVFANTIFDKDGKILAIHIDSQEVATPNYDGAGMPHFSGFPGQGGYNNDVNHDGTIVGKTAGTEEAFFAEIASWKTKRARGDEYKMTTGTWTSQMNKFESIFVGKTAAEVEDWFNKYTSPLNGRPLKDGSTKPEEKTKYDALTKEEKAMLADVTTAATMSLKDAHGDILGAIKASFTNKFAITLK
jgi:hypothetical protein